jgi:hypothetical protein
MAAAQAKVIGTLLGKQRPGGSMRRDFIIREAQLVDRHGVVR